MFASRNLCLTAFIALALAEPTTRELKVHESRDGIPDGFSFRSAANPDMTLKLRLALVQSNIEELHSKLLNVSTPTSGNYGKHLSKDEVQQLVAPSQNSVDAVNSWLGDNGLEARVISANGEWLAVEMPVRKAKELFDADFSVYAHDATGTEAVRTLAYSIPVELDDHLDLVHPTITFPNPSGISPVFSAPGKNIPVNVTNGATASSCSTEVTPACIQSLYGLPATPATQQSNQLAVSGFIEQFANQADLKTFLSKFRPDIPSSTTFSLQTLDGGENPQNGKEAGVEANLDIQYTVGLATETPVTFISVGKDNQDGALEGFLDITNFLLNETFPPQVLTTSYGQNEDTISRKLANVLCNAYAQLGARGTSVLFASGDGGVSGSHSAKCTNFVPTFPSGCPYITSVGATQGANPETAASFSSGGFSNYFPTPSYQEEAVAAYLAQFTQHSGKFNASGRGYPDVAAQGVNFQIVVDGKTMSVSGTSCASPTFASVVAIYNDQRIARGLRPLGFLNPLVYMYPAFLNDITSGSNSGCNTNGFQALNGWDPVTGLGTPDFSKLPTAVGL